MGRAILFIKRRIKRGRRMTIPTGRRKLRAKSLIPRRRINIVKGRRSLYKIRAPMPRPFRRISAPWLQLTRGVAKFGRSFEKRERSFRKREKEWSFVQGRAWSPSKSVKVKKTKKPATTPFKKGGFGVSLTKKRKEYITWRMWFADKPLTWERRGGKRDMSKVKYPNYGQFPKWLGPHIIFNLRPTERFRMELKIRKGLHDDIRHVERTTKLFLDELRGNLITHAKIIINKYVPKDTGDLREAMIKSIEDCKRNGYSLKMVLAAPIDYAGVVNRMPQKKVRHDEIMGVRSRKTGKLLHDPLAQKGSYYKILMQLKEKTSILVYEMITKMVLMWNMGVPIKIKPKTYVPEKPTMTKERRYGIYRKRIPWKAETSGLNIADPVYEDRIKYSRRAEMWKTAQTTPKKKIAYPFDRKLIGGFFKISGLYK